MVALYPPQTDRSGIPSLPNETLYHIISYATSCSCDFYPQEGYAGEWQSKYHHHFFPDAPIYCDTTSKTKLALVRVSRQFRAMTHYFMHEIVHIRSMNELLGFSSLLQGRSMDADGGIASLVRCLVIKDGILDFPNDQYLTTIARIMTLCHRMDVLKIGAFGYDSESSAEPWAPFVESRKAIWSTIPKGIRHLELPDTLMIPNLSTAEASAFVSSHPNLKVLYVEEACHVDHIPPELFSQMTHLHTGFMGSGAMHWELPNLVCLNIREMDRAVPDESILDTRRESLRSIRMNVELELFSEEIEKIWSSAPNLLELRYNLGRPVNDCEEQVCQWDAYYYEMDDLDGMELVPNHKHDTLRLLEVCIDYEHVTAWESRASGGFTTTNEDISKAVTKFSNLMPIRHLTKDSFPQLREFRVVFVKDESKPTPLAMLEISGRELARRMGVVNSNVQVHVHLPSLANSCSCDQR